MTQRFENACDWVMVYCLCALIFVLPVSIALVDTFAGLAVIFYFLKKIKQKNFKPSSNPLNRPLLFLTLAMALSVVFSQYPPLSLYAFFGKFVKCLFLYFAFVESFSDEARIWIFLRFFLLSAFITSLSGFMQHYTGVDFLKGHTMGAENGISTHRINSSFFGANGLGAYLLPVVAITAHLFFTSLVRRQSKPLIGILAVLLVLLLTCLCWTYSRSAWLAYLVMLGVMWWMDLKKWLFALVLFLIFIFFFLPSLYQVRNLDLINDNSGGQVRSQTLLDNLKPNLRDVGSGRWMYWKRAMAIIRSSPLWGTGLNTYTKINQKKGEPNGWHYAHNCYLQMAAETGLLGLACFLWVIVVLLLHGFANIHLIQGLWPRAILQGSIAGLSGLLVQAFFDNTFYTVQLGVLLWMTMGLVMATARLKTL